MRSCGRSALRNSHLDAGLLQHEQAQLIAQRCHEHTDAVIVDHDHLGVLIENGRMREQLGPGLHVWWRGVGAQSVRLLPKTEQLLEVNGQELLTTDPVSIRCNLSIVYRITDFQNVALRCEEQQQLLYRAAQLALRQEIGTRSLHDLLGAKSLSHDSARIPAK